MTETTTAPMTYRVTWPIIQILGQVPFSGRRGAHLDRQLRRGDIMPDWVPEAEVSRLLARGCIEEIS